MSHLNRIIRIGRIYYNVKRIAFILLVMLPLALAKWQVYVSPSVGETTIYGYADEQGCISVISGRVIGVKYFVGDGIDEINDVGDYFCVPDDTIFSVSATSSVTIAMPAATVDNESNPLVSVSVSDFGSRTILQVESHYATTIAILVATIFAAVLYLMISRRKKGAPTSHDEAVIEYVAKHPGCTQKEICNALGLEKYQVSRILSRLEQRGVIVRVKRGISKRVYLKEQLQ